MPSDQEREYRDVLNDVLRGRYQGDDAAQRLYRARMALRQGEAISAPDHAMRARGYDEQLQQEARDRARRQERDRQQAIQDELSRRMFAPNTDAPRRRPGMTYQGMIIDETDPRPIPPGILGAINPLTYATAAARNTAESRQREAQIHRAMQQMMDQMNAHGMRSVHRETLMAQAARAVDNMPPAPEEFFDIEGTDDAPQA